MRFYNYLNEGSWKNLPNGWTDASVKKFAQSLTGKDATKEGFFDACVAKMTGKLSNPEAFCATVKDHVYGTTYWRGKGKKDAKPVQK